VQVDPIKPTWKAPGPNSLKLKYDKLLSFFAFKFNLRRYKWVAEFHRWCPTFPVVLYHGNKAEREAIRNKQMPTSSPIKPAFPVVVTSFEIVMADRKFLQKYNFKYLVVRPGARCFRPNIQALWLIIMWMILM